MSPVPMPGVEDVAWEVGEPLATWWRPHFEPPEYPYLPAHCARAKECRKLFMVPLPPKCKFAVPTNLKLIAVPLVELYNNSKAPHRTRNHA